MAAARFGDRGPLGDTGLVAGREIQVRLRARLFQVVTVILFGVVAAAVVIPTLHAGAAMRQRVGVVASSASLEAELHDLARSAGLSVELVNEPSLSQARAALSAGHLDMVVDGTGKILVKQDQVQTLALPLSAPLIFGYIVSLIGASSGSPSLLVKVLAYLPPTAPFAMPTLVGFGAATWWQFLLSVMLTLGCTLVVAVAAARVYRSAILQTGGRVRWRELLPALTK